MRPSLIPQLNLTSSQRYHEPSLATVIIIIIICSNMKYQILLTFNRGTLSFSGDIMARISLVKTGGAPTSVEGAVPNSKLHKIIAYSNFEFMHLVNELFTSYIFIQYYFVGVY